MAKRVSREEFEHLCRMIQRWNENRLELFEISLPTYEVRLCLYTDRVHGSCLYVVLDQLLWVALEKCPVAAPPSFSGDNR